MNLKPIPPISGKQFKILKDGLTYSKRDKLPRLKVTGYTVTQRTTEDSVSVLNWFQVFVFETSEFLHPAD